MKCASDSAPWRPLGDQTPNMLGGVYLQKYSERNKYKTLDRLPSSSSPSSLSFVYVVCVRLSIKTFGISISILDARQRLRSGPGHLLDGAALFSAPALLIYSANRSVFKVNTFTVAWLSVLVFEATAVDIFMARLMAEFDANGLQSHLNWIHVA